MWVLLFDKKLTLEFTMNTYQQLFLKVSISHGCVVSACFEKSLWAALKRHIKRLLWHILPALLHTCHTCARWDSPLSPVCSVENLSAPFLFFYIWVFIHTQPLGGCVHVIPIGLSILPWIELHCNSTNYVTSLSCWVGQPCICMELLRCLRWLLNLQFLKVNMLDVCAPTQLKWCAGDEDWRLQRPPKLIRLSSTNNAYVWPIPYVRFKMDMQYTCCLCEVYSGGKWSDSYAHTHTASCVLILFIFDHSPSVFAVSPYYLLPRKLPSVKACHFPCISLPWRTGLQSSMQICMSQIPVFLFC